MIKRKEKKCRIKKRLLSNLLSNQNIKAWSVEPQLQLRASIRALKKHVAQSEGHATTVRVCVQHQSAKTSQKRRRRLKPGEHVRVGSPPQEGKLTPEILRV